jgi:toxin ParE1/3/4
MSKTYKVIFSRYAEEDVNEIIDYYLAVNKEYALKLLDDIETRVNELKKLPERGRIVPELEEQNIIEYRELIEGYYRIVYAMQSDTVIVHTIVDGRRNFEEIIVGKLMRYYS